MRKVEVLFYKMLNNIKVEVTKEERDRYPDTYQGRFFDVLSISNDTITICSKYHVIIKDLSIDVIK